MMNRERIELEGMMSPWLRGCIGVAVVIVAVSGLALAIVPLANTLLRLP